MPAFAEVSRRDFLRNSAVGAASVSLPYYVSASALGKDEKPPASERIQIGLIGCGGMGQGNLENCASQADVVVTAACDVWKARRDAVVARHHATAKPYHDYREMLARKN